MLAPVYIDSDELVFLKKESQQAQLADVTHVLRMTWRSEGRCAGTRSMSGQRQEWPREMERVTCR